MVVAEVVPMSVPVRRVTVKLVQKIVARRNGLTTTELLTRTRKRHIARPRQIAMYLATKLTRLSLPDIGWRFGGFDHTTVMYARDIIKNHARGDRNFALELLFLEREIFKGAEVLE